MKLRTHLKHLNKILTKSMTIPVQGEAGLERWSRTHNVTVELFICYSISIITHDSSSEVTLQHSPHSIHTRPCIVCALVVHYMKLATYAFPELFRATHALVLFTPFLSTRDDRLARRSLFCSTLFVVTTRVWFRSSTEWCDPCMD